jgi:hypothetical protein
MSAALTLDLPWVEVSRAIEDLEVRRGRESSLAYDDGIVLEVRVVDPGSYTSSAEVIDAVRGSAGPGRVGLVAGVVPPSWRAALRDAGVSFVDVSGVAEIDWPRIQVSAHRFGQPIRRRRAPLSLQKGHASVTQELIVQAMGGSWPSIGELASNAGVSMPTASKAVSQLEAHGLVVKHRDGHRVSVEVVDLRAVAERLAERTAWPGDQILSGYLWGRNVFDAAARLCVAADRADTDVAVTGRVGAAFLGVLGTASPGHLRMWVDLGDRSPENLAQLLGLEPATNAEPNVFLSNDSWGVGVERRIDARFDDLVAWVAHPLRIWCDLTDEQRGSEFAAQMWRVVMNGR